MTMWKQLSMAAAGAVMIFASVALAQTPGTVAATGDERVKAVQQALKDKGHDPGQVDGKLGPRTQAALRDFQQAQGMAATGRIDMPTMRALGVEVGKTGSAGPPATSGSASPATERGQRK
jgi:peptidoglycan hydrolase-like protein with peptidoglycan-binding domain